MIREAVYHGRQNTHIDPFHMKILWTTFKENHNIHCKKRSLACRCADYVPPVVGYSGQMQVDQDVGEAHRPCSSLLPHSPLRTEVILCFPLAPLLQVIRTLAQKEFLENFLMLGQRFSDCDVHTHHLKNSLTCRLWLVGLG